MDLKELLKRREEANKIREEKSLVEFTLESYKDTVFKLKVPDFKAFIELCGKIGITDFTISKKEIEYLTGGWFEEYVYYTLKDANIVQDTDILCGVSKKNGQSDNEFDIVILKENQLHIIECKTYICNNDKPSLPVDTIYKLDSIQKELGLFAKPYIITLNKAHEIKEAHKKRAGQYGIKILTIENIVEGNLIDNIFPNASKSL